MSFRCDGYRTCRSKLFFPPSTYFNLSLARAQGFVGCLKHGMTLSLHIQALPMGLSQSLQNVEETLQHDKTLFFMRLISPSGNKNLAGCLLHGVALPLHGEAFPLQDIQQCL